MLSNVAVHVHQFVLQTFAPLVIGGLVIAAAYRIMSQRGTEGTR